MTETEKQLIENIQPRIKNWRRAYRDKNIKNISITYAAMRALAETRDKTDFSEDYTGPEDRSDDYGIEIDQQDADLLNLAWQNLSTPDTEMLSVGTHGLNVRTAKLIILLYTFSTERTLRRTCRSLWRIRDSKSDQWTEDALIFFALRVKFFENIKKGKS
ncbi:hypothetical protein [uncultured Parasutterella sp.]|uniref:hypothetical protein n=1 Tax=uncultured Parasutterella sp. TaxID=1263098 RepID=UPI0025B74EE5|nr:hypothetical protein [uncultured Parasutterella sp.]